MKIILANSIYSYISRVFVYSPIILGSILFSNFPKEAYFFVGGFILSYLLYICNFCWYLGFIKFKKEYIYTPNDFVPRLTRLQYKEKIYYKDIFSIEFKDADGNSIGKQLWKADSISYLEIITNDSCVHRIAIGKYSHRQWKQIEIEFIKYIPNVLIIRNAEELIKYRKY